MITSNPTVDPQLDDLLPKLPSNLAEGDCPPRSEGLGDAIPNDEIEHDLGFKDAVRQRERTCIATRTTMPISSMVRFVKGPEGQLVPDIKCSLPGRGVWVSAKRSALTLACQKNAFARGLKYKITAPISLVGDVEALLKHDALQALGMANKAGAIVSGSYAIEIALPKTKLCALLHSLEAAEDGKRKLDGAFLRQNRDGAIITCFTNEDFSLVFGASHAIHAAVVKTKVGNAFLGRVERWLHFQDGINVLQGHSEDR